MGIGAWQESLLYSKTCKNGASQFDLEIFWFLAVEFLKKECSWHSSVSSVMHYWTLIQNGTVDKYIVSSTWFQIATYSKLNGSNTDYICENSQSISLLQGYCTVSKNQKNPPV